MEKLKDVLDIRAIIIIILIGLVSIFVDGPKLKRDGYNKELKILKIISYSYMGIGIILFILLKFI